MRSSNHFQTLDALILKLEKLLPKHPEILTASPAQLFMIREFNTHDLDFTLDQLTTAMEEMRERHRRRTR